MRDRKLDIRIVSTYPPRRCGVATFSRDLANALGHFTEEVHRLDVAAIDDGSGPYGAPVDLVIDQRSGESWRRAAEESIARAKARANPAAVVLQHEYGLDPDENGRNGKGTNFVDMTSAFAREGLSTFVYLHTVLDQPDPHQRRVLQQLARLSDGLIVTTESALEILESPIYGIGHSKLTHIDHGIRMHHPSEYDRLAIKRKYGLEDGFLVATLGMVSPDKGIQYGIRAYGRFLEESCTQEQRRRIVYLIAGEAHPGFVRAEGGRAYRDYRATLADALERSGLRWCRVEDLRGVDFGGHDVVFLDAFLDEVSFLEIYGAANVVVLPYLNLSQISSGILAETLGSGRAAIATKFRCALELIHSNKPCPSGVVIGRYARGILVDPGEDSVGQIARALDLVVFNEDTRLRMEKEAHQRGYQMGWHNTAWALLQQVGFVSDKREILAGRGARFLREKPSILSESSRRARGGPGRGAMGAR
jgi:glycosyltransferase involved in cell wall biosynthesis